MKRPLVASLVAAGVFAVGGIGLAAGTMQFRAHLDTANEIPAPTNVVGDPTGDLKLKLSPDGQELRYDLKITSPITDMFMAHLHAERNANDTGPIVVWLFPSTAVPTVLPPVIPGETDGRIARGVITPADLTGPLAGNWAGFLAELRAGTIYANVHTAANRAGEIRDTVHLILEDDED
jgi:CHRD domain